MHKAVYMCLLTAALGAGAQDKKADPCAALRLENAQLKVQLAALKEQFLQAQNQIMAQQYQQVLAEKKQAEADLKAEQEKQGKAQPVAAQRTPEPPRRDNEK